MNARPASIEVPVLREDLELADVVPHEQRAQATDELTARLVEMPPGPWPAEHSTPLSDGIGYLVLGGMLIRRVGIDGRFGAELLGEGDLLRPWQDEDSSPTLALTTAWSVISPARLAVLDDQFAVRLSRYPQLVARLIARTVQRSRHLAVNMAIVHQARVDSRLEMLFWHLAARWGRVRGDGTVLPVRLTHAVLADLVAARRPTVTSALSDLARRGVVRLVDDAWLLSGEPPRALVEMGAASKQPDDGEQTELR